MNAIDFSKKIGIESIIDDLFINNKSIIAIENDDLDPDDEDIIESDLDDDDELINKIHEKLNFANIYSFAIRSLEKCSKSKSQEELVDDATIINNDSSKNEYDESIKNENNDDEKLSKNIAAVMGSTESDEVIKISDNIGNPISEKFWKIILEVFRNMNKALILFIKRVITFTNNELKAIDVWFLENGDKNKDKICNDESFTFSLKFPKNVNIDNVYNTFVETTNDIISGFQHIDNFYHYCGLFDSSESYKSEEIEKVLTLSTDLLKKINELNISELNKRMFKDGSTINKLTSKEFFQLFSYSNLNESAMFNKCVYDMHIIINIINSIENNTVKKAMSKIIENTDIRKKVDTTFINLQSSLTTFISTYVYLISYQIYLIKASYKFCKIVTDKDDK